MVMKIFVTGFQRSGTTLLRDLISKHPDVQHMFHETGHLAKGLKTLYASKVLNDKVPKENNKGLKSSKVKINFDLRNDSWGEKIPYYTLMVKKGRYNKSLIQYIDDWNKFFYPDSAIIHIIRHPYDIGISTKNRGYSSSITKPIKMYSKIVPIFMSRMKDVPNVFHLKYEDLLYFSEAVLQDIFDFCKLKSDYKTIEHVINSPGIYRFDKINRSRAFNFVNSETKTKIDLKGVLKVVNKIGRLKYHLDFNEQRKASNKELV
jgi:hypothetical protein